ncbi:MAG: hypothetical protein M1421_04055 [Candidatus Eremiobacteraeota bacterium]|jgi:hypothetical protein|nr:hypothetical protein [Candidatus Eremiobacteraeota bacterium]MCL5055608.1 hypothetical protein [Bacillota bacterium]
MKTYTYSEFMRKKRELIARNLDILVEIKERKISRRPRDLEEREFLIQADKERHQNWLNKGILEVLGPRQFRIHFDKMI